MFGGAAEYTPLWFLRSVSCAIRAFLRFSLSAVVTALRGRACFVCYHPVVVVLVGTLREGKYLVRNEFIVLG